MKTFYFNIQAKGASGKSLLTYLLALKNETNQRSYFLDFSTNDKTSLQQLKFIQGKNPKRFGMMSLINSHDKFDRQLIFTNLLELSKKDFDEFFLDFGALESSQLLALFSMDYSIEEIKQIESELSASFVFNIVVAGGGAYMRCTAYLQKFARLLNGLFTVNIYVNQSSFFNHEPFLQEIEKYASATGNEISAVKYFGDFDNCTP
jgi:hypothetical protein